MSHIDPDYLSLIALGEDVASESEKAHLLECAECRRTLDSLTAAADVGKSTLTVPPFQRPAPEVWHRITGELGLAGPVERARPWFRRPAGVVAALAAAAAIVLVAGVIGVAVRPPSQQILASATLDAFPDWTGSTGSATVVDDADTGRVLQITLDGDAQSGLREVWLMTAGATQLVSLGYLDGDSGVLPIPADIDLKRYDLVDISNEPLDGDPTHSGDSIVRGRLGFR